MRDLILIHPVMNSTTIHYIVHMHRIVSLSKVNWPALWSRCALQKNRSVISIILQVISDAIQWHFSPHSRLTTLDCQSCISFLVNSIWNSVCPRVTQKQWHSFLYLTTLKYSGYIYYTHTYICMYTGFLCVCIGTYKIM